MNDKIIVTDEELNKLEDIVRLFHKNVNKPDITRFEEPIRKLILLKSETNNDDLKHIIQPYFSGKYLIHKYWEFIRDVVIRVEGLKEMIKDILNETDYESII